MKYINLCCCHSQFYSSLLLFIVPADDTDVLKDQVTNKQYNCANEHNNCGEDHFFPLF